MSKFKLPAKFARPLLHLQSASPKLMFVTGVVGVVASTVLACRSTLKVSNVLTEGEVKAAEAKHVFESQETLNLSAPYTEEAYTRDLAVLKLRTIGQLCKLYAVPVAVGIVSIGLLTGSHVVLNQRNASLTAAYAAADKAFKRYREKVRAELGDEKDDHFRYDTCIIEEKVVQEDGKTKTVKTEVVAPEQTASQYARFFDELSEYWKPEPEYNRIFLETSQAYLNNMLIARGHVFLNEVYDALGLERSGAGAVVGWIYNGDGDNYIDFGIFDTERNERRRAFVNGVEHSVFLDFNVDGVIYDKINPRTL